MAHVLTYLDTFWAMLLDMAPWLLLGLLAAGVLRQWLPQEKLGRWLGGRGLGPILRAALLGAPLPLCSCSVLPAGIALRRQGASPQATAAFLVSTPETGLDSLAISYVFLGPLLMVFRLLAAVFSAVVVGLLVGLAPVAGRSAPQSHPATDGKGCCTGNSCCPENSPTVAATGGVRQGTLTKLRAGLRYTALDLLPDIQWWLLGGVAAGALVATLVPPQALSEYAHGLPAMLAMVLVGVPLYVCASASTPVAAGLLLAGVSPGTALVFLLAGPATNLGALGVLAREMGKAWAALFVTGIAVCSIAAGLAVDRFFTVTGRVAAMDVTAAAPVEAPPVVAILCLLILLAMALYRPLIRRRKSAAVHLPLQEKPS